VETNADKWYWIFYQLDPVVYFILLLIGWLKPKKYNYNIQSVSIYIIHLRGLSGIEYFIN
jgi:hypothetical protein